MRTIEAKDLFREEFKGKDFDTKLFPEDLSGFINSKKSHFIRNENNEIKLMIPTGELVGDCDWKDVKPHEKVMVEDKLYNLIF
jgi:hypothetical protein